MMSLSLSPGCCRPVSYSKSQGQGPGGLGLCTPAPWRGAAKKCRHLNPPPPMTADPFLSWQILGFATRNAVCVKVLRASRGIGVSDLNGFLPAHVLFILGRFLTFDHFSSHLNSFFCYFVYFCLRKAQDENSSVLPHFLSLDVPLLWCFYLDFLF